MADGVVRHHDIGGLHVAEWGPADASAIVAIHGITSSHLAWTELAAAAPDLRIIAPDLRGRGASSTLPGPWGMSRHAADVVAVLDALGLERAPLVGHSMGGFVAQVTAAQYPRRVPGILLVDGGFTLAVPQGFSLENPAALIGPAAARLEMTFETPETYRDFWRGHPSFVGHWTPAVQAYVDFDLVDGRSRTSAEATKQDAIELYGTPEVDAAVAATRPGTTLLTAPRGLQNEVPPLYPQSRLDHWAAELPGLTIVEVPDTNHYTIVMAPAGAAVVAEHARLLTP